MANGPGVYDELCSLVRGLAKADGAILLIHNGSRGNGFSVQAPPVLTATLPLILADVADEIFQSLLSNTGLRDTWWEGLDLGDRAYWMGRAGMETGVQGAWVACVKQLNKRA